MHELSLCYNLLDQLQELARVHRARSVAKVSVRVGMLAGVEAQLLETAFSFAKAGTIADAAELTTELVAPCVHCETCGSEAEAKPNDLRCPHCGSNATRLIDGDGLILARVELVPDEEGESGDG